MANWITPFWKQTFVTLGAALNMAQFGFSAGYVVAIVPQLQLSDSPIPLDDDSGSWLASSYGITIIFSNIIVASIMGKCGRWKTSILSLIFALAGWISIALAGNLPWLFTGRLLQGLNLGLIQALAPVVVGECSSPKYRGIFLTSLSGIMSLGTLSVHVMSSFLHWRTCAIICLSITFINFIICIYSPESPSWLASQGRYEDCKKAFRWLRGNGEEEELYRLIEASKEVKESKTRNEGIVENMITKTIAMFKKTEVYKPIIISIHLLTLTYWSGLCVLATYPDQVIVEVSGKDVNIPLAITTVDLFRFLANSIAMYIIKRFKRKSMLLVAVGLNVITIFVISGYSYARNNNKLPFDEPIVGIIFIHVQMILVAIGILPLSLTIAGEIFPLEYRSLAMGFTSTVTSVNLFISIKTYQSLVKYFSIYGSYLIYGIICTYCLVVSYILLPETKDRILQDIEDEFKGKPLNSEDQSNELFLKDVER